MDGPILRTMVYGNGERACCLYIYYKNIKPVPYKKFKASVR